MAGIEPQSRYRARMVIYCHHKSPEGLLLAQHRIPHLSCETSFARNAHDSEGDGTVCNVDESPDHHQLTEVLTDDDYHSLTGLWVVVPLCAALLVDHLSAVFNENESQQLVCFAVLWC